MIVEAVYGVAAAKLGQNTVDVIRPMVDEVIKSAHDGLESRLGDLIPTDVASELNSIAAEIATWSRSRIVVRVDKAEQLSDRDVQQLAAIAGASEPAYLAVIAISSADPAGAPAIDLLATRGVRVHSLHPLTDADLGEWLESEGIDPERHQSVARLTNGYPLFIEAAIGLIHNNVPLTELEPDAHFRALQDASWKQLGVEVRTAAARMAVFADAPPSEFLCRYLKIDVHVLGEIRDQLSAASIFVATTDGSWFHDRRRAYVWEQSLTADRREAVAGEAFAAIGSWLQPQKVFGSWVYRSLPAVIRALGSADRPPYLAGLIGLSDTELAIMWALIEMTEPNGRWGKFPPTDAIAFWAERRRGSLDNVVGAFERLQQLEMTASAADEHASITGLVVPDAITHAAIIGEIEFRFAVAPIQYLASSVFQSVIRPRIPKFRSALIAGGVSGLDVHRADLETLAQSEDDPRPLSSMIGLGVTVETGTIPVAVTITFDDEADRTAAVLAITGQSVSGTVRFGPTFRLPPTRARWRGLVDVLRKAEPTKELQLQSASHLVELTQQRALAEQIVARNTPVQDAVAVGLNRSRRYLVQVDDALTNWVVLEVDGGVSGKVDFLPGADWSLLKDDPIREVRLRELGVLSPNERISRVVTHWNRAGMITSPLLQLAEDIEKSGKAYNKRLPRVAVSVEPSELEPQLHRARQQRDKLAVLLREASLSDIEPSTDSLILEISRHNIEGMDLLVWMAATIRLGDGQRALRITRERDNAVALRYQPSSEEAAQHGVADRSIIRGSGHGDAAWQVGPLLGFDHEDVQFPRILDLDVASTLP